MMRASAIAAATCAAMTLAGGANAQESILDFFKGFGQNEEEAAPSPTPPDATSSYFANKQATLPVTEGGVGEIAGAWTITTERDSQRCSLDGAAQIAIAESGGYTCDLVMRDYCEGSHDGIIRQSCVINIVGSEISVNSTVIESLNGATLSGYSPDDFVLEPADDGSLVGVVGGWSLYPTKWTRTVDGIS